MTCQRYRTKPTTLFQAKEDAGFAHGFPLAHSERYERKDGQLRFLTQEEQYEKMIAVEKSRIVGQDGWAFICGDFEPEPLCRCGFVADLLCDYPVGNGKTCDAPICSECSKNIGPELDLCMVHALEHRATKVRLVP